VHRRQQFRRQRIGLHRERKVSARSAQDQREARQPDRTDCVACCGTRIGCQ
jgi:hypothetical protein